MPEAKIDAEIESRRKVKAASGELRLTRCAVSRRACRSSAARRGERGEGDRDARAARGPAPARRCVTRRHSPPARPAPLALSPLRRAGAKGGASGAAGGGREGGSGTLAPRAHPHSTLPPPRCLTHPPPAPSPRALPCASPRRPRQGDRRAVRLRRRGHPLHHEEGRRLRQAVRRQVHAHRQARRAGAVAVPERELPHRRYREGALGRVDRVHHAL